MIQRAEKREGNKLDWIFNFANYKLSSSYDAERESTLDNDVKEDEDELFKEITEELESEIIELGMNVTFSTSLIISQLAMNLVLLAKAKLGVISEGLLRQKVVLKIDSINTNKNRAYPSSAKKSVHYDNVFAQEKEIHPLIDKLIPKLQKQVNEGLKHLGLLPMQQMERQKLTVVKKLRQQYKDAYGRDHIVEAKAETKKKHTTVA